MATIPINLSTNELLKGVEQLAQNDLEDFVKKVLHIRAKRLADNLNIEEATLLEQINIGLTEAEQLYLQDLTQKSEAEVLTESEHKAYLDLAEKSEFLNGKRLIALSQLAQLRSVSLENVMEQLGLLETETV